jgi:hypothetical protein
MRRRRAAGYAWEDPAKEAERKARWYHAGGKELILASTRRRREQARQQAIIDFLRTQ